MKLNKMNVTKIAAALALLGSMGAHAGTVTSVQTATANIKFAEAAPAVAINLTAVDGLKAGDVPANTLIAHYTITPTNTADTVALRYTPGTATVDTTQPNEATLSGKTNGASKLNVYLSGLEGANAVTFDAASGFYHKNAAGALIGAVATNSHQPNVAADTYVVSLDAAIYHA